LPAYLVIAAALGAIGGFSNNLDIRLALEKGPKPLP
jgi:hypothetical protein